MIDSENIGKGIMIMYFHFACNIITVVVFSREISTVELQNMVKEFELYKKKVIAEIKPKLYDFFIDFKHYENAFVRKVKVHIDRSLVFCRFFFLCL